MYYFRKNVYDLVLLDLKMPQMNGLVLSQELQNIDPTLLYRIITAANKEYIETLKTNSPFIENNIIYKPLWLNELRTTIHSLLSNKGKQQKEDKDCLYPQMIKAIKKVPNSIILVFSPTKLSGLVNYG